MATRAKKTAARTRREKGTRPKKVKKARKPKKHRGPLLPDRAAPAVLLEAKRKTREVLNARERDLTFVTLLGRESKWVRRALPA